MKHQTHTFKTLLALGAAGILCAVAAIAQTATLFSSDSKFVDAAAITTDGINFYVASGTTLLRVPVGGGTVTQIGTSVTPCCVVALAVKGTNLFYIDPNGDPDATAIWRIGTNGGTPVKIYSGFATGQPIVDGSGLATDGARLYTADEVQGRAHTMNFDGSGITFLGSRYDGFFDLEHHNAVVAYGNFLYFADDGAKAASGILPQILSLPKTGGGFATLAAGAPLVSPSSLTVASNMVFVADPGASNTIWMLPLAGGTPIKLVSGAPFTNINSIVAYSNALYVTDTGGPGAGGRIYKVTLPVPTLISSGGQMTDPGPVANDANFLYVGNGADIISTPLAGGPATTVLTNASPCCVAGMTTSDSALFWIDPNGDPDATAMFRAPLAGGAVTKIYSGFDTGQAVVDGVDVTTDGVKLYTADEVQGQVHSMNLDGSSITLLGSRYGGFFDLEHRNSIAQSGSKLYIADDGAKSASGIPPQILSLPKTGGAFTTLRAGAPLVNPTSLAVAGTNIYIADPGATNTVWRLPITGGTPVKLVSGSPFVSIRNIAYLNGSLYVSDTGNMGTNNGPGALYRLNVPGFISAAPVSLTTSANAVATFSVTAGGTGPFTYQWQMNGTNLPGATASSLTLSNTTAANAGRYTVVITSPSGTVTATATLTVFDLKMYAGLTLGGASGSQYRIEYKDNLNATNWTTLTNVTLSTTPSFFLDANSPSHPSRFYRAVPGP